jgi:transcriptional regulator with XRE-family HTH domain
VSPATPDPLRKAGNASTLSRKCRPRCGPGAVNWGDPAVPQKDVIPVVAGIPNLRRFGTFRPSRIERPARRVRAVAAVHGRRSWDGLLLLAPPDMSDSRADHGTTRGEEEDPMAGLRREEVATLSGINISWYSWLEQGRASHPSRSVLDAVARNLSCTEHAYVLSLTGYAAPPPAGIGHGDLDVRGVYGYASSAFSVDRISNWSSRAPVTARRGRRCRMDSELLWRGAI